MKPYNKFMKSDNDFVFNRLNDKLDNFFSDRIKNLEKNSVSHLQEIEELKYKIFFLNLNIPNENDTIKSILKLKIID